MMQINVYKCARCKKQMKREDVRYDIDGRSIVCNDCLKLSKVEEHQKDHYKVHHDPMPQESSDKVKLFCKNCRYKFSLTKGSRIVPQCPYCNGTKIVRDEFNVDKVIREAAEKGYDDLL